MRLLFEGGDYSKNYSNSTLHSIIDCLATQSLNIINVIMRCGDVFLSKKPKNQFQF